MIKFQIVILVTVLALSFSRFLFHLNFPYRSYIIYALLLVSFLLSIKSYFDKKTIALSQNHKYTLKYFKLTFSIIGLTIVAYSFLQLIYLLLNNEFKSLNFSFIKLWVNNISKGLFNSISFFVLLGIISIAILVVSLLMKKLNFK